MTRATAPTITAEEVRWIRDWHFAYGSECHECEEVWPCPTIRLLDALDAERAIRAVVVEMIDYLDSGYDVLASECEDRLRALVAPNDGGV